MNTPQVIIVIDEIDNISRMFLSIHEASREVGGDRAAISKASRGVYHSGYKHNGTHRYLGVFWYRLNNLMEA